MSGCFTCGWYTVEVKLLSMSTLIAIFVFAFGAIIGSFLNVVILRFRSGKTLGGRSMCFSCGKTLGFAELVPIASFLTQGGKCAGCKTKISWQYPAIEALMGVLFVLLYVRLDYLLPASALLFCILFAFYAFVLSLLVVMSVYDLRHHILPDGMTFLFAAVSFISMFLLVGDAIIVHIPSYTQILAGVLLPAPFTLLWWVSKGKWMGLGDSKLMIGIGFLLGLSAGATAILLSFWIGAIFSVALIVVAPLFKKGRVTLKTAIPFGPFLAVGTVLVVLLQMNLASIMRAIGAY